MSLRTRQTVPLLVAFALLARAPLRGGGLEVWNATEATVLEAGRLGWSLFGSVRTQKHFTHAYDFRVGSQLGIKVTSRFSVTAGYLRRRLDPSGLRSHWESRLYAGPSFTLASRPLLIRSVTILEHNFGIPGAPAYKRSRPRLEIERRRKGVSPFLSEEFTFRREGFVRSRSAAGVRWRSESGVTVELAYQFDTAQIGHAWRPRHVLRTAVSFGLPFSHH